MIKILGSMLCKDCVQCRQELDAAGVEYIYCDFSDELANLKAFLALRDKEELFAPVREEGRIGIPCIIREDGSVTLDWQEFL